MAKEQKHGNKEARKPKAAAKQPKSGPKYMAGSDMAALVKGAAPKPVKKS